MISLHYKIGSAGNGGFKMSDHKRNIEEMVMDMIRFLKKWGMWKHTRIFAEGNAYDSDDDREGYEYNGLSSVKFEKDVDPAKYVRSPLGEEDFTHIFDMTFEGPLYEVLACGMLITEYGQIGPEGWDQILENGDFAESFFKSEFGGKEDILLSNIISEGEEGTIYSMWDPLKYEDFDEYIESDEYERFREPEWKDESELIPAYTIFDTYEDYLDFLGGKYGKSIQNNPLLKNMAARYIKKIASTELECDEVIIKGEAVDQIKTEFRAIFDKYGLDYCMIYNWMLAGYETKEDPEKDEKIGDQKKEAAERLKFLGVSEKDIRAFEDRGMIPAVIQLPDGKVKREMRAADFSRSSMKKAFRGNLPYLTFVSRGFIPMDAYLYVEENSAEREFYRGEMVQGSKKQIMSAVVFSDERQHWEYGSIEIELTEDGPVRTG